MVYQTLDALATILEDNSAVGIDVHNYGQVKSLINKEIWDVVLIPGGKFPIPFLKLKKNGHILYLCQNVPDSGYLILEEK